MTQAQLEEWRIPVDAPEQPWWIVVGRLAYDDEDSLYVFQAEKDTDAMRIAEQRRRGDTGDYDDREFYLNYLVRCATRPELVVNNA
jgi:hypothetical protein